MNDEISTREEFDDRALSHYGVKGQKHGVRQYQNEDGSLTPLGRIHYGVGMARDAAKEEIGDHVKIAASKTNVDKIAAKAQLNEHRAERTKQRTGSDAITKFDYKAAQLREKEKKLREKEEHRERSDKEIKKDVEDKIKKFNENVKAAKEERKDPKEELKKDEKTRIEEERDIRFLADAELDKRIARLKKEKEYSELLNERYNREKGPAQAMASKLFKNAAEKMASKALDKLTDKVLKKAFGEMNKNNNNGNNGNNKDNGNNSNNNSGNGQKFSKGEKSQIRSMAGSGKSVAEIAKALGTTEDKVKNYMSAAGITIS